MSYSVYIKYRSKRYKLPVNPEEIKKKQKLNIEKYQVLGSGQVSLSLIHISEPTRRGLLSRMPSSA